MKTIKHMSVVIMVLLAILTTTAGTPPNSSEKGAKGSKITAIRVDSKHPTPDSELKQCGVTNAQITSYLQNCSHHHTVYWVSDIPGTCNSTAGIEGCGTATVYVQDNAVIGHIDHGGFCDGPSLGPE